jgi:hypothetical protein
MNVEQKDKAVGTIFRAFAKMEVKPDAGRKLQDRLYKAIDGLRQESGEALIRAFELVRDYWHEASRLPEGEYATCLRELLRLGFVDAGGGAFLAWVNSLAKLELRALSSMTPNPACAEAWLKASKGNKKAVLNTIAGNPEAYYGNAWGDWFVTKAQVKVALPMVRLALEGRQRAAFLPPSHQVLRAFLKRDKKGAVAEALALDALGSSDRTRALVHACVSCGTVGEPYARGLGTVLAKRGDAETASVVSAALSDLLQERDAELTRGVSQFAAHVVTTWRLAASEKAVATGEEKLQGFAADVLLGAQANERLDLWVACTSGTISERVLSERGKVSPQGALQVALALRAAETDATAADALWSAAFNLGIRELERAGEVCVFDPRLHEDSKGGLLRGDSGKVIKCGWQFGEQILVRALVEPV